MPRRSPVLVGEVFSRLTVLQLIPGSRTQKRRAVCRCICGNECTIICDSLNRGTTKSCGCLHSEAARQRTVARLTRHNFHIGQKFGRLTVADIHPHIDNDHRSCADCVCQCGNTVTVLRSSLVGGNTHSCGCLYTDILSSGTRTTHGQHRRKQRTPEHAVWGAMVQRCTNPNSRDWPDYGGRGIQVCSRWLTEAKGGVGGFREFIQDMGPRPSSKYSIDRIDNSTGYGPNNCRWTTSDNQALNRRPKRQQKRNTNEK